MENKTLSANLSHTKKNGFKPPVMLFEDHKEYASPCYFPHGLTQVQVGSKDQYLHKSMVKSKVPED